MNNENPLIIEKLKERDWTIPVTIYYDGQAIGRLYYIKDTISLDEFLNMLNQYIPLIVKDYRAIKRCVANDNEITNKNNSK